jgi:hypothetical protein
MDKNDAARRLAEAHHEIESYITRIVRVLPDCEQEPAEPFRISGATQPLYFSDLHMSLRSVSPSVSGMELSHFSSPRRAKRLPVAL